jgi:hypothetical protein
VKERDVRGLVYDISLKTFGVDHPTTQIASKGPSSVFPQITLDESPLSESEVEMIPDLERSTGRYIS